MRRYYGLTLLALLVVALCALSNVAYYAGATQQPGNTNAYGEVPYCVGIVKYPNWGLPDVAYPGGNVSIHLWGNAGVKSAVLENGSLKVKLKLVESSEGVVEAKLPEDIGPGMYDLILNTTESICGIHNAIWVPEEKFNTPSSTSPSATQQPGPVATTPLIVGGVIAIVVVAVALYLVLRKTQR